MDVFLFFNGHAADMVLAGRDLEGDDTLYTAVLISLFTDARAGSGDELPPELLPRDGSAQDLRGWWGDALQADDADGGRSPGSLGSKLWLLRREKQMPQVAARARRYAREALAWLVREGMASAVDVQASMAVPGRLDLAVAVTRPSPAPQGTKTLAWNFIYNLGA